MSKIRQWLKSKTINFGLLLSIAAVVQVYIDSLNNALFTMLISVIVVILRFKTTEAVEDK